MQSPSSATPLRISVSEPRAFGAFYQSQVEALYRFLARRVYDRQVALDLVAETFAQAYLGRHRFRGTTDVQARAWLYGIAKRQLALYFRRARVERRALERLAIEVPRIDADEAERLDRLAGLEDQRALLATALERVSEPQRAALQLRVVEELPYREVARQLGISEGAARVRVTRALKTLARVTDLRSSLEEMAT